MKFKLAGITIYDNKISPNKLKNDESEDFEKAFILAQEEVENILSQLLKGEHINDFVNYPVTLFSEVISKKGIISQNTALAIYYRVAAFYIYLIEDSKKKDYISEIYFNKGKILRNFLEELAYAIINDEQINQYNFKYLQDWIKQLISKYTDFILGSFVKKGILSEINQKARDEIYRNGLMICEFIFLSIRRTPSWIALEYFEKLNKK